MEGRRSCRDGRELARERWEVRGKKEKKRHLPRRYVGRQTDVPDRMNPLPSRAIANVSWGTNNITALLQSAQGERKLSNGNREEERREKATATRTWERRGSVAWLWRAIRGARTALAGFLSSPRLSRTLLACG